METTCAILAGGRSRRMGRDKAMIQIGNATLISRTYETARRVFPKVMIVSSLHEVISGIDAPTVRDVLPVSGSLTGIVSALISSETPYVFVLGCDMPFLSERAIRHVMDANRGESIVIPRTEAGYEPMHAMYHRCCISAMLNAILCGRMKIGALLPYFSTRIVPANPLFVNDGASVFMNVNTWEDVCLAERALP
jgi:molybdenum cofactor guanylyltransferase